jgi:hypothetical protein
MGLHPGYLLLDHWVMLSEPTLWGSVEKDRQPRSRPLAVLTYSSVRSARPSGCALAGRAFLNTPLFFSRNPRLLIC